MMFLWLACTTEIVSVYTSVPQESQTQIDDDTAYLADVSYSEPPSISEIENIVQMGIEQIRETRVGRLLDVYDEMLEQTDTNCPRWFNNSDGLYWADTCTSEDGVFFQGFATSRRRVVPLLTKRKEALE